MRLEVGGDLADIGDLESLRVPPAGLELVFWDTRRATVANRRCALFDGFSMTPDQLLPDEMHTLFLGVFAQYCLAVFWALVEQDVFRVGGERVRVRNHMAGERLRHTLKGWYSRFKEDNPDTPLYEVRDFSIETIGGRSDKQVLRCKAAETGSMLRFAVACAHRYRTVLHPRPTAGDALVAAGDALLHYITVTRSAGPRPSAAELRGLMDSAVRFLRSRETLVCTGFQQCTCTCTSSAKPPDTVTPPQWLDLGRRGLEPATC